MGTKTKTKNHLKNIKVIVIVALAIMAIGFVGQGDLDYENRASVCRQWQGSTVCYKP